VQNEWEKWPRISIAHRPYCALGVRTARNGRSQIGRSQIAMANRAMADKISQDGYEEDSSVQQLPDVHEYRTQDLTVEWEWCNPSTSSNKKRSYVHFKKILDSHSHDKCHSVNILCNQPSWLSRGR
jgi:hypothetical protein